MQTVQTQIRKTAKSDTMLMPDRLDSGTVADMEQTVRTFIQAGVQELVLDCSSLHTLTSAGLHAILAIAKLMQNVQGKLMVANLEGQPLEMFKACGFDQIISTLGLSAEDIPAIAA